MITGEYRYALDEKGRLMVPAKVRSVVTGNVMILTRGVDRCLWLFPAEEWRRISEHLIGNLSPFQEKARLIQRRILAPAQEAEIDRSGRIAIPQSLRLYAGLSKDCTILGMIKWMEIWDEATYATYLEESDSLFKEAAEEFGGAIKF
jgi:MraZ protein